MQKIGTRVFTTRKEATIWAKEQKVKHGPDSKIKYDINRLTKTGPEVKWKATIYKEV